ncbi:ATP-binding cassette domain-containing protein [Bowmanella sp. Y26]|uniref:ABC transporter ATP-binding protein n=1 Tax=Bowmanella yangjiangensis TaxID=2811230 RepID=UPI001BDC7612|nr:ATP-binding cassette domain-containing protein [Bowmanella yangjiangensis]MBT1062333.1 ATP-binding cassette domain-containing protein [Bowmanella yangjiangensis]
MTVGISLRDLTHQIPVAKDRKVRLLDKLDLQVQGGQQVAIVGASGSGKTTLLSVLAGLEPIQQGQLALHLHNQHLPVEALPRYSGFVFQQFHLLPELDAINNVALPLKLRGDRQALAKAADWLDKVGLHERYNLAVNKLSGGEQQRVAIARAMVCQPGIVFADEPTGNLDEHTADEISRLMLTCCRESRASLVLITHNKALAQQLDVVYHLQQGRLSLCQ